MYVPKSFEVDDLPVLHQFIEAHNFGTLVTIDDGVPIATHLPFMIDTQAGKYGKLIAHMAKANSQWKTISKDVPLLVIFQGPHAYISSGWYEEPTKIPTWNYTAVHVYGTPRVIHDADELNQMVSRLVRHHDADMVDADYQYPENKLNAIVGFEIMIERIEGKYKLNQNRSRTDQERVAQKLQTSTRLEDQELGAFMHEQLANDDS